MGKGQQGEDKCSSLTEGLQEFVHAAQYFGYILCPRAAASFSTPSF